MKTPDEKAPDRIWIRDLFLCDPPSHCPPSYSSSCQKLHSFTSCICFQRINQNKNEHFFLNGSYSQWFSKFCRLIYLLRRSLFTYIYVRFCGRDSACTIMFVVSAGSFQQNGLDSPNPEIQRLQKNLQNLEFNVKAMSTVSQYLMLTVPAFMAP